MMDSTMRDALQQVRNILAGSNWQNILEASLIVLVGWFAARFARRVFQRLASNRLGPQGMLIGSRLVQYGILGLAAITALQKFTDLSVLLGAAGILTIALGFASQTSVSNIISGLFLVGEKALKPGDVLQVGTTTGEVIHIDLLSIKIRTFDNLLIRIPNETLLKTDIVNKSRFPIRRADILLGVAYKEDIERVRDVLLGVAEQNPSSLDEPSPLFQVLRFGESSVDIQFSVWTLQDHFIQFKTQMFIDIKKALDAEQIEIPFPHRTLYTGSATEPLPVRLTAPTDP